VKDALQLSAKENSYLKEMAAATMGVMFLGTPYHGSKAASMGKLAFRICKLSCKIRIPKFYKDWKSIPRFWSAYQEVLDSF